MKKRVLAAVCMAAMAVTACSGGSEGEGAQAGGKQKLVLSTYGVRIFQQRRFMLLLKSSLTARL